MATKRSFRLQLTLWFGGLTLATLAGVGLYVGQIATRELVRSAGETMYLTARSAADLLTTNLRDREQEIDLLRRAPLFVRGDLRGPEVLKALELRKQARSEYAWIGVVAPDGRVLQATDGLLAGANVQARDWFRAALKGPYTGDVHDAVLLAAKLPKRRPDEPLRFVDFAAPILDERGQVRGVLGTHALWSWVTDTVDSVVTGRIGSRPGEMLIADREGNILYPAEHIGRFRLPEGIAADAHYAIVRWTGGEDGAQDYLTSAAPLGTLANGELGWRIVLRQPVAQALVPAVQLRNHLLLTGLIAALLFGLLAYRLARRLSRPVEQLARAARAIERREGNPAFPADPPSSEIAALASSVQSMTRSLLAHEAELARINASLEQTVAERTAELERANRQLADLATRDALTGVANRRRFDERLREQFLAWRRSQRPYALLMVDADHFKRVNDTYGHQAGDEVLKRLAETLVKCVRATDFVARYGGEEFVVLLPDTMDVAQGLTVAEKIRETLAGTAFAGPGRITVSLGLSLAHPDDETETALTQRADQALYQAKAQGRDRVVAG